MMVKKQLQFYQIIDWKLNLFLQVFQQICSFLHFVIILYNFKKSSNFHFKYCWLHYCTPEFDCLCQVIWVYFMEIDNHFETMTFSFYITVAFINIIIVSNLFWCCEFAYYYFIHLLFCFVLYYYYLSFLLMCYYLGFFP